MFKQCVIVGPGTSTFTEHFAEIVIMLLGAFILGYLVRYFQGAKAQPTGAALPTDDVAVIEGIGPKIAELLQDHGIRTFRQLADTSVENLKKILSANGGQYRVSDPTTWPEQAALAADGKWDELKKLQGELKGGRRTS